jgi:hypothetical protein
MKPQHHFAPGVIVGGRAAPRRLPKAVLAVCLVIVIACISAASLLLEGARP